MEIFVRYVYYHDYREIFTRCSYIYALFREYSLSANKIIKSHKVASRVFHLIEFAIVAKLRSFRRFVSAIPVFRADCLRTKLPGLTQSIATSTALATDLHECNRIASWTKMPQPLIKSSAQLPWNKAILAVSKIIDDKVR